MSETGPDLGNDPTPLKLPPKSDKAASSSYSPDYDRVRRHRLRERGIVRWRIEIPQDLRDRFRVSCERAGYTMTQVLPSLLLWGIEQLEKEVGARTEETND